MTKLFAAASDVLMAWDDDQFNDREVLEARIEELEEAVKWWDSLPSIVCLCGSTRFYATFQEANLKETLAGNIVLSIGCDTKSDNDLFNIPPEELADLKGNLDRLHFRKIELADRVVILNCGGYIGESTRRELEYARQLGKRVEFWEEGPQ